MKPWSLALLFTLLLTLLISTPVSAAKPDTAVYHWDGIDPDVVDCTEFGYDFKIQDALVIDFRETTYYDKTGAPIRLRVHGSGTDNLFHPDNPDYMVSGSFVWNSTEDLLTGESKVSGAFWHITLPGYGAVYFDSGQGFWDSDGEYSPMMGHHELDPILCEVLDFPTAHSARTASVDLDNRIFLPAVTR